MLALIRKDGSFRVHQSVAEGNKASASEGVATEQSFSMLQTGLAGVVVIG